MAEGQGIFLAFAIKTALAAATMLAIAFSTLSHSNDSSVRAHEPAAFEYSVRYIC
jgi:hypothetical protein